MLGGFFIDGLRDDMVALPQYLMQGVSYVLGNLFGETPPSPSPEAQGTPPILLDSPDGVKALEQHLKTHGTGYVPTLIHGQEWAHDFFSATTRLMLMDSKQIYHLLARIRIAAASIMGESKEFLNGLSGYEKGRIVGALTYEVLQWTSYGAAATSTGGAATALAAQRTAAFIGRFTKLVPKCNDIQRIGAIIQKFSHHTGIGQSFANGFTDAASKFGCFVAGTPVWTMVHSSSYVTVGAEGGDSPEWPEEAIPIERVQLAQRIITKNPRPEDYDTQWSGREFHDWYVIRAVAHHANGSVVDVELLRPLDWIILHGIAEGVSYNFHFGEIEIAGSVTVTSIERGPTHDIPGWTAFFLYGPASLRRTSSDKSWQLRSGNHLA